MVIRDLNVKSVAIFESETYTPLIVNTDRVLSFPVLSEMVKPVSGRHLQILQPRRYIDVLKLSSCPPNDIRWEPSRPSGDENILGMLIREGPDHIQM